MKAGEFIYVWNYAILSWPPATLKMSQNRRSTSEGVMIQITHRTGKKGAYFKIGPKFVSIL